MAELPIEFIEGAMTMARDIIYRVELPRALQLCLGLFKTAEHFIVLDWSPLRAEANLPSHLDHKDAAKRGLQWVVDRIYGAISALDQKAKDLFRQSWPMKCMGFRSRGMSP